mmetsp:Transcript_71837/g.169098  ORF Transcript_71837/g.169098 Transcript_71837/m.169098 type:complete len:174 (+) Transcript_71837:968-1489(+)
MQQLEQAKAENANLVAEMQVVVEDKTVAVDKLTSLETQYTRSEEEVVVLVEQVEELDRQLEAMRTSFNVRLATVALETCAARESSEYGSSSEQPPAWLLGLRDLALRLAQNIESLSESQEVSQEMLELAERILSLVESGMTVGDGSRKSEDVALNSARSQLHQRIRSLAMQSR